MIHWTFYVAIAFSPLILGLFTWLIIIFLKRTKIRIKYENVITKYKFDDKYKKLTKLSNIILSMFIILIVITLSFVFAGIGYTYFSK